MGTTPPLESRAQPLPQATPTPSPQAIPNSVCLTCHSNENLSITLPNGETLGLFVDDEEFAASVHGLAGLQCINCHVGYLPGQHPTLAAQSRREWTLEASPVCQNCHKNIYEEFIASIHGSSFIEGNFDLPTCVDCHGTHKIPDPRTAAFLVRSPQLCATCHADAELMAKYGISREVFNTYVADFHGTTVAIFSRTAPDQPSNTALCIDCHGVHNIIAVDDPESPVVKTNLVETCRKCHPGADASFVGAWTSHYSPRPERYPLTFLVNLFYTFFIPTVLGGMVLVVGVDIYGRFRRRGRTK